MVPDSFVVTATYKLNSLLIIYLAESFFIGCRPGCHNSEISLNTVHYLPSPNPVFLIGLNSKLCLPNNSEKNFCFWKFNIPPCQHFYKKSDNYWSNLILLW